MKRYILIVLMFCTGVVLHAREYQHGIGLSVGTFYGISYKGFIFPIEELALQVDAGIRTFATGGTAIYRSQASEGASWKQTTLDFNRMGAYDLEVNPNILYQRPFATKDWGTVSWYAGGGTSIGFIREDTKALLDDGTWAFLGDDELLRGKRMRGKFGLNAIGGIEMHFTGAPLSLSIDFRPGYGFSWARETEHYPKRKMYTHFFDWECSIALRYCFTPVKREKVIFGM